VDNGPKMGDSASCLAWVSRTMKALLSHPLVYLMFQRLVGAGNLRQRVVANYVRPKAGDRILDIGCGTADILEYLPSVDYVGFDANSQYVQYAQEKFAGRGHFFCQDVSQEFESEPNSFDIVLAIGLLHHLSAADSHRLLTLAHNVLKHGGRLVTLDNCYTPDQSPIAKYLISRDRGEYLRTQEGFLQLARPVFKDIQAHIHHDGLRIPYTHLIMEMRKTEDGR